MKPLDGTFAQNALKHGVAGLNIDGGRIGGNVEEMRGRSGASTHNQIYGEGIGLEGTWEPNRQGRFPANLILDEVAAAELDRQSGTVKVNKPGKKVVREGGYGKKYGEREPYFYGDQGGASRFFYVAKAGKKERGEGNNHPTVKPLKLMEYLCTLTRTPTGGTVLDPFLGSGTTALAARNTDRPCIGIEMSPEYMEIIKTRLAKEEQQQKLFA